MPALQAIEREWVPHFEVALDGGWRSGQTDHDRLDLPGVQIAWSGSDARWGRLRVQAEASYPESDRVPAGEPFGTSVALPALSDSQTDKGIGGLVQWAPRNGLLLELGTTPTSFEVSNLVGGLRFRFDSASGALSVGIDRTPVEDSLLSYAGTIDPLSGRNWGGVIRDRAYLGGRVGDDAFTLFGAIAASHVDGHRVDSNTEWRADAGFLLRAASGGSWNARVGGAVEALGFAANRSHFTLGHGGYFSPEKFLSVGPVFEVEGRREERSFRIEGGVAWQEVREESSDYFPTDAALQAASGDPRYPGDSRDGIGLRLAASMEWRVTARAVAGVRLEGVRGEDARRSPPAGLRAPLGPLGDRPGPAATRPAADSPLLHPVLRGCSGARTCGLKPVRRGTARSDRRARDGAGRTRPSPPGSRACCRSRSACPRTDTHKPARRRAARQCRP